MFSRNVSDSGLGERVTERVYSNMGNSALVNMLDKQLRTILDIGCGAGDNAALIRSANPECNIYGITHSASEAGLAQKHMVKCWVADVEKDVPDDMANLSFDVLIFSHVLEHLREPAAVLARYSRLLRRGGQVLVAVPNVLSWRMRLQFLRGDFRYETSGVLDDTHLHFFTFFTADQYLLSKSADLSLIDKVVTGSVPLWWLRRHVFPQVWCRVIDDWGSRHWPNLFGDQVLLRAVKG